MNEIQTIKKYKNESNSHKVICECCGEEYDYDDGPIEFKQGCIHICIDCWGSEYN